MPYLKPFVKGPNAQICSIEARFRNSFTIFQFQYDHE